MRKIKIRYIILMWLGLSLATPLAVIGFSGDLLGGFRLNSGDLNQKIDAASINSVCRNVTNVSGNNYSVPTRTAVEWEAFLAHLPSGVTVTECLCGNGVVDAGEECDDSTMPYMMCSSINNGPFNTTFTSSLTCNVSCQYDESNCDCIGANTQWYNNYGCDCALGYLNCDNSYGGFTGNGCETTAGTYYNGCCGDGICNVPADGATYAEAVSICPADCGCGNGICNYTASGENPDGYCYQDCEDRCLGGVPSLDCIAPDTCLSVGISPSFCGQ